MRTTKRLFALLLALTLVFALCATAFAADFPKNTFTDVPRSAWYAEAVDFAQASGLMNGVGDNKFDPNGSVTRAMVATVLYRLADKPSVSGQRNPFRDVPNDAGCWFRDAAIWANKVGVTNGDGSADVFSPNKPITREQMASMIIRFLLSQADLDESSANMIKNLDGNMAMILLRDEFKDADQISSWARVNVLICKISGVMNGDKDGTFRPQATLSRAECAQTFLNLYKIGTESN